MDLWCGLQFSNARLRSTVRQGHILASIRARDSLSFRAVFLYQLLRLIPRELSNSYTDASRAETRSFEHRVGRVSYRTYLIPYFIE